jgi:sugar-specific transcriptional regulator TrmB
MELNLEKIGLTEGESKVYLALLRIGPSTIGNIIKEAQVSNSKIYDILDRLNKKGLIGVSSINNVKNFEAKSPVLIKELIAKREEEIKIIKEDLPRLEKMYGSGEQLQEAEILQGINGIKNFTEMILEKLERGDTFYILGTPRESIESLGAYFQDWHARRAKKGIKCKILYNEDLSARAKKIDRMALTEIGILPNHIIVPTVVDIGKDYVATLIFGEKPLCIVIKNRKVYESYLSYFDMLWKQAK